MFDSFHYVIAYLTVLDLFVVKITRHCHIKVTPFGYMINIIDGIPYHLSKIWSYLESDVKI